ncbi:MAG: hypothetical protein GXZ08_07650 [Tissierellia bacterium]|nr:hypothetical protein [Tissierellia bacterium]
MKALKAILLLTMVIILSSCGKTNENVDVRELEEITVEPILKTVDDFEHIENNEWLVLSDDNTGRIFEGNSELGPIEWTALEKSLLENMEKMNIDIDGLYLILDKNDFQVFWSSKLGEAYLFNQENESLQFLMETETAENYNPEELALAEYLKANADENTLHLTNGEVFLSFDHLGKLISSKEIPENYNVSRLNENYAILNKDGKNFIYIYSDDAIKYEIDEDFYLNFFYLNENYISKEGNTIYCIDFINEKLYSYIDDEIENMDILTTGKDKILLVDVDKQIMKKFQVVLE